jgi:hypothetical protein
MDPSNNGGLFLAPLDRPPRPPRRTYNGIGRSGPPLQCFWAGRKKHPKIEISLATTVLGCWLLVETASNKVLAKSSEMMGRNGLTSVSQGDRARRCQRLAAVALGETGNSYLALFHPYRQPRCPGLLDHYLVGAVPTSPAHAAEQFQVMMLMY